jgi:hypothetical protein
MQRQEVSCCLVAAGAGERDLAEKKQALSLFPRSIPGTRVATL